MRWEGSCTKNPTQISKSHCCCPTIETSPHLSISRDSQGSFSALSTHKETRKEGNTGCDIKQVIMVESNHIQELWETHLSIYPTREARQLGHLYANSCISGEERGTLTSLSIYGQGRWPENALPRVKRHRCRERKWAKIMGRAKAGT